MKKPILPKETDGLPDTTEFNVNEVWSFFGYSDVCSFNHALFKKRVPKPDKYLTAKNSDKKIASIWLLGSLRKQAAS